MALPPEAIDDDDAVRGIGLVDRELDRAVVLVESDKDTPDAEATEEDPAVAVADDDAEEGVPDMEGIPLVRVLRGVAMDDEELVAPPCFANSRFRRSSSSLVSVLRDTWDFRTKTPPFLPH